MSNNTASNKQSSNKRKGTGEKHFSPPSTPEIKRKDVNGDGKTSENEDSDSDKMTSKRVENINSIDIEDTTRKRTSPRSGEEHINGQNKEGLFPGRRPSCHRMESAKQSTSRKDVSLFPVTKNYKGTLKEITIKLVGSISNEYRRLIYLLPFCILGYVLSRNVSKLETNTVTIDSLKQKFPKQNDVLWKAVTSGLIDTLRFEQPSSYILIHEREADVTVKALIRDLSQYAVCHLSNCSNIPITLNNEVFNSAELVDNSDYGVIITKFKRDLENIGVMVIENLDEIPEKYALAFHSFCDQVSPLVKKSAFFFTLKIDKLEESSKYDIRRIEKILRGKWKHMENDIFSPLFTRIAEMPIRIQPE